MSFPKFVRLSDNAVVTEGDIDPLMTAPSMYFRPDESLYARIHDTPKPAFNEQTEKLEEGPPAFDGTFWNSTWVIVPATADEVAQRTTEKAAAIRAQRDKLLRGCDHTQLLDSDPAKRGAWVQYRQDLKNVPDQAGFPWNINWPTPPA